MPTLEEEEAFSYLRARQGTGARYDAETAPSRELTWARHGTAYFARLLNNLRDTELYELSAIGGWTRAHVVAAVSFNARDLTRLVEAVRMGIPSVTTTLASERNQEIEYASTLPARALRNLFKHSEVHLNVEWRDLTNENWKALIVTGDGVCIPVFDTPLLRAKALWSYAMDLDAGGVRADIPIG